MSQDAAAVRNLLYNLVRRDLTVRYKSTVLGFFWSFVKPLALTAIFYVVFDKIIKLDFRERGRIPFALHLLTGMLAWTFFAGATGESLHVILANANLIKKLRLPLVVFPLSVVISHFIHFLMALLVLMGLLILAGLTPTASLLLLPPIVLLLFLLTLAVALALAALNVFYRDIGSFWEVLTTAWFYATPIIYPVYTATDRMRDLNLGWLKWLYLGNPLTPIVLACRQVLLYAALDRSAAELPRSELWLSVLLCLGVTVILAWLGRRIFSHYAHSFADEL
jgi:ABC-type polysaccharide/polyol phosphate export permease